MNVPRTLGSTVFEGDDAKQLLAELGLDHDDLARAVVVSELERRSTSPLEPSGAAGYKAWSVGFRALCEALIPKGWKRTEHSGLPRLVNPEAAVAVAIVNGDDGTGSRDRNPKSRAKRGEESISLVRTNFVQLSLPFAGEHEKPRGPENTWWLLIYSDGKSTLRAELSLCVGTDDEDRLAAWKSRIILQVEGLEPATTPKMEEESPARVDVIVRPK
jgi:hypothetical protein